MPGFDGSSKGKTPADEPVWRRRLYFRCWHRGTREMDILLGRFADRWIDTLSIGDLTALDALLGESDPDLYNWITGQEDPPAAHCGPLMERLRQSAAAG